MKEAKAYCGWHFVALNEWGVCPECRKQELKELAERRRNDKVGDSRKSQRSS